MEKKQKRREVREAAASLSEAYCKKADREIARRVMELEEYQNAETLFCFVGTAGEIDTSPLLEDALARGKRVCVPLCTGPGIMEAHELRSLAELREGSYGIREPGRDAPLVGPEEIGLSLVPCLSCSRDGRRLGHGGGYYDRYLRSAGGTKAVLCRSRLMREDLVREPHDVWMDLVVSEERVWQPLHFHRSIVQ